METELPVLLSVENVQALASKELEEIPPRYIRPELMTDSVSIDEGSQIPIIDLSRLIDQRFSQDEMTKFHLACQHWGFFQLINHGVSEEALEKMKADVTDFFKLPLEEKMEISQEQGQLEGYGQAYVFSKEQKLDWGDMIFLTTQPVPARNMKCWPTYPVTFRETLDKYSSELQRIEVCLLSLMAKNLGIEQEKFTNMFKGGMQSMRLNYYPPCPEANKVLGISPHSDATGITFLLQVNHVQGLQIRHDGRWVPVKLFSDALLVNIGDVLEILSNGRYKSIEHRVVINKEKERLSVAAFHELNEKVMIGPLSELVKGENENYRSLSCDEYYKLFMSNKLDGKILIDLMRLKK